MSKINLMVKFVEADWQRLKARSMLEARSISSIVRSAAMFYAKYGPWNVNRDMIEVTEKLKGLKTSMVVDGFEAGLDKPEVRP
jgi:hypothetical protein